MLLLLTRSGVACRSDRLQRLQVDRAQTCLQRQGIHVRLRGAWLNMADAVVHSQRCPSWGPAFTNNWIAAQVWEQTLGHYADYLAARRQIHGWECESNWWQRCSVNGRFFLAFLTGYVSPMWRTSR